jgi:acyl carrier protein
MTSLSNSQTPEQLELLELIVKTLNLDGPANEIDPESPIYGDGLGLDSIDILEISLAISKHYGIQLKSDDENNKAIYQSVKSLCDHVNGMRAQLQANPAT